MVPQITEQLVQRAENRNWVTRNFAGLFTYDANACADVPFPHY